MPNLDVGERFEVSFFFDWVNVAAQANGRLRLARARAEAMFHVTVLDREGNREWVARLRLCNEESQYDASLRQAITPLQRACCA